MQRKQQSVVRETFTDVLKKRKWSLIIPAILLILVIAFSVVLRIIRSNNEVFHSDVLPVMLDLNPIAIESSTESLGSVLTETAPVDDSYFADALFVGDSLCDGVRVYQEVFPGYRTATKIGLGIEQLLYDEFYSLSDEQKLSAIDHVSTMQPAKLYIMIGTNDILWNEPAKMAASYGAFIDEVLVRLPSCKIIVQSIPPTTADTASKRTMMSQERIKAFNEELKQLAIDKGVYFLDVYSVIVGEDGYMRTEIAAPDGIHMQPSGYALWCNYMKTHAVQSDASYSIGADGYIKFTQGTAPQEEPEQTGTDETPQENAETATDETPSGDT